MILMNLQNDLNKFEKLRIVNHLITIFKCGAMKTIINNRILINKKIYFIKIYSRSKRLQLFVKNYSHIQK